MKKFKLLFAAVVFSAASVVGYNAYSDATMTEQEHLLQANLEALTNNEGEGISLEFCFSGSTGSWKEGYMCADGTTTSITAPGVPIGVIYTCPAHISSFSLISRIGYCYKNI